MGYLVSGTESSDSFRSANESLSPGLLRRLVREWSDLPAVGA